MLVIYLKKKLYEDYEETIYSVLTLVKKGTVVRYDKIKPVCKKLSVKFLKGLESDSMTFLDSSISKPEDIVRGIGEDPRTIIKHYTTNESERINFIL